MKKALYKKVLQRRNAFLFLLPVILLLIGFIPLNSHELVLHNLDDKTFIRRDIHIGDTFGHHFIHSVEKSLDIEKFYINDQYEMVLNESWTKSFGAGLPSNDYGIGTSTLKDGFYVIENMGVVMPEMVFLPTDFTNQIFFINDEEFAFYKEPFVNDRIKVTVERKRVMDSIVTMLRSKEG